MAGLQASLTHFLEIIMALLAEEIVEEWLNQQGYFTIRGIKLGVQEIDLLAVKYLENGSVECRHIEVQASIRPVSYISRVPVAVQKETGRAPNSAKRSDDELVSGVAEWVQKKFLHPRKVAIKTKLWPGAWSQELVVNNVKSDRELELIASHGIKLYKLTDVVRELESKSLFTAAGADFVDLILMGATQKVHDDR